MTKGLYKKRSRVVSWLICLTMVFTGLGLTAMPASADTAADVTVRIVDASQVHMTRQPIHVELFNIEPFLQTGSAITEPTELLSAHALIEAVYYSLYDEDPSALDLALSWDSQTAAAIRAECDINGASGLWIESLFGNSNLGMSTVNNRMDGQGIGKDRITDGDHIVFYSYEVDKNYAYFEIISATPKTEYGADYLEVKLRLQQNGYDSSFKPITEPVAYAMITEDRFYPEYEPWTDANGIAVAQLYPPYGEGYGHFEYNLSAVESGILPPYCQITYDYTANGIENIWTSERIQKDTSLKTFIVDAGLGPQPVLDYAENNRTYFVPKATGNITLAAIVNDSNASIASATNAFPRATGGEVLLTLSEGDNKFIFTVQNDPDKRTYSLTINRASTDIFDAAAAGNRIVDGILSASDYPVTWYDADWITAMATGGRTISTAHKENFLKSVLTSAPTASAGMSSKMVLALSALGIDATKVPDKNSGGVIDLVKKVYEATLTGGYLSTDVPYRLLALDTGVYTIPQGANSSRENLIEWLLDNKSSWNSDADAAGIVIPSLSVYYKNAVAGVNGISAEKCDEIKAAVDQALANLMQRQEFDGNFGNNSNSDSMVILGLSALGIDANGSQFTKGNSVINALVSTFETSDHRLGYQNQTYNEFASKQGLMALIAYLKYDASGSRNGNGNLYNFNASVAPYTNWPEAKLLTGIMLAKPDKTNYKVGDGGIDRTGMAVYAVYNNDINAKVQLPDDQYTVDDSGLFDSTGNKTVTISYQGYISTFVIHVSIDGHGPSGDTAKISLKVKDNTGKIIVSAADILIEPGVTSVLDALKTVLDGAGISLSVKGGGYVSEINGLAEFDQGSESGWLFSINGKDAGTIAPTSCILNGGEAILWYYTLDYTKDPGSRAWSGEAVAGESEVSKEITAKVGSDGKAIATITNKDMTNLITDACKKSGTTALVFDVKGEGSAKGFEITLESTALKQAEAQKEMKLTVRTTKGEITFDHKALTALLRQAGDSDVKFTIAQEKDREARPAFTLTVTDAKGNAISEFEGGIVAVRLPYALREGETAEGVVVYHEKADKTLEPMATTYDKSAKMAKFTTTHFSSFIIGYDAARTIAFSDVKQGSWYYESVMYLAGLGIMKGKQDTLFAPADSVTRAEFAAMLARMSGETMNQGETKFEDVAKGSWYAPYVEWALHAGIVKGVSDVSFAPGANITRQDMAVMMDRYAAYKKIEMTEKKDKITFMDEGSIASYARGSAEKMQKAGVVNGIPAEDGTVQFLPMKNASRAEAAMIIANFLKQ